MLMLWYNVDIVLCCETLACVLQVVVNDEKAVDDAWAHTTPWISIDGAPVMILPCKHFDYMREVRDNVSSVRMREC